MPIKVFLLGRPGNGKSTAFHAIAKYLEQKRQDWSLVRIKDYAILYEMFLADNEGKKFCSIEHGGFEVLDFSVLDEASLKLEKHIKQNMSSTTNGKLVIIEFARSDYYESFKQFNSDLLRDSYFLFIETDVETCIQRIHERITLPIKADNHYVSDNILRSYYQKDNINYIISNFKKDYEISKKVEVIYNNGSMESFVEQVNRFVDFIFEQEDGMLITTHE
jgi:nucleoside-triphosphatase THEP1